MAPIPSVHCYITTVTTCLCVQKHKCTARLCNDAFKQFVQKLCMQTTTKNLINKLLFLTPTASVMYKNRNSLTHAALAVVSRRLYY